MTQASAVGQLCLDADVVSASELPFHEEVLDWVTKKLVPAGLPRPFIKRLALIICGLVATDKATMGQVVSAVDALAITQAKAESIARRLQRTLKDARLEPSMLSLIFTPLTSTSWPMRPTPAPPTAIMSGLWGW